MLGKLCALCLCKYVRLLLHARGRVRWLRHVYPVKMVISAPEYRFTVAFSSEMTHNYTDTDDSRFTSARASSAGPEHTGCHPPAPPGCERSSFSRQRILRSERSGAGKYEMLRSVEQEGRPVVEAAQVFGLSRPVFYVTQELFK